MNILIFGGTRFIGMSLVQRLLSSGHFVTIVSRKSLSPTANLTCCIGERDNLYANLKTQVYDCIVDFTAYSEKNVADALNAVSNCPYILISTCWVDALGNSSRIFYPHEQRYIESKLRAENMARGICGNDRAFTICRLPITFGNNDHSQRFKFYSYRVAHNRAIILINGGANMINIAFKDDISWALNQFVNKKLIGFHKLCNFLPSNLISPRELVLNIAEVLKTSLEIREMTSNEVEKYMPKYSQLEPLWRELPISSKFPNLNKIVGVSPTHSSDWINEMCKLEDNMKPRKLVGMFEPDLLAEELKLVN